MSKLPPAPPLPGSSAPPAPAAPAAELGAPADPTKVEGTEPPAIIDTLVVVKTTTVPKTERACGYPRCDKVMAADVPCDLHEQICGHCGEINIRNMQSCKKCGAVLPALPIVLETGKPDDSTVNPPAPAASAAPAPSSQAPVSGSVTLPPVDKPAGLSAVEDILDAAEEPEAVIMSDPPPPPPATPEEKAKDWLNPPKKAENKGKGKAAADTVKVPPLAPPRHTRVEEPEAPTPAAEKEPARKSRFLAALAGMGTMMRTISLIFILIILGGLALHHTGFMRMHNPSEPKVVEKVVVREVPATTCPAPTKAEKAEPAKPVKKVSKHRRSRPATAEKEITFEAKDLVHVWNGPVDHLLDKDED